MWAGIGASPTFTIVIFNIIIINVILIVLVMIIFLKEGQFRIGMVGLSGCYLAFDHNILLFVKLFDKHVLLNDIITCIFITNIKVLPSSFHHSQAL